MHAGAKTPNEKWLNEIQKIYANYQTFSVDGINDQVVFDLRANTLKPRCQLLIEGLLGSLNITKIFDGLIMDVEEAQCYLLYLI